MTLRPRRTHTVLSWLAATACALFAASPAAATTLAWANAAGGSAATASNWSPVQVPTAADPLQFSLAGTYPISFNSTVPSSPSHLYRRGTLALSCSPFHSVTGSVTMGSVSGDAPNVTLNAGTLTVAATSIIGSVAGTGARLGLTGFNTLFQVTNAGADLRVGGAGTGTLDVQAGSIARVADDLIIGNSSTGLGIVSVSGVSGGLPATLRTENVGGDCFVGQNGTGTIAVSGGGFVRIAEDTYVAYPGSATGTVSVGNGVGASRYETLGRFFIGANDVGGAAAGTGTVNVNAGGTVVCGDTLRVGDPDAGPVAKLFVNGGDVITRHLVVEAVQGNLDYDGGSLTVDGGRALIGASLSLNALNAVDDGDFILRRGAVGTVGGSIVLNTGTARRFRFEVDSGSSVTASGFLGANGENVDVVVDSSSILTLGDRFYLGGASNQTTLAIGVGSVVEAASMECTDGGGATSAVTVQGAGATLRIAGNMIVGGDEAFVGGPSTVLVANGGSIVPGGPSMNLRVRAPGFVDVASGGSVNAGTRLLVEGRVRLQSGGALNAADLDLAGNGRLEARGVLASTIGGTDATSTIVAQGNLDLGVAASSIGFDFRGTLDAGPHLVRLFDAGGTTLGDTTRLAGGTLDATGALNVPSTGALIARGTVSSTLTNNGKVEVGDAATFGILNVIGSYTQTATGTTSFKVKGPGAGESDRLIATSALGCAGTLRVVFAPGAALPPGSIPLLTGNSRTGTFSGLIVEGIVNPGAMSLLYTGTEVRLLVSTGVVDVPSDLDVPSAFAFRGTNGPAGAAFELALPAASDVRVDLFDAAGRRAGAIVSGLLPAGYHRLALDGAAAPSARRAPGVYFARARIRPGTGGERMLHDRIVVLD